MNILLWIQQLFSGKPHFVIGSAAAPYMLRWYLTPRNPWLNVYLHKFLRDDDDRALHDHPWASLSICIKGRLLEHRQDGTTRMIRMGTIVFRQATYQHRLEVVSGPAWTLFLTGRKVREWGFWCPKGFVVWKEFVKSGATGEIGKGCDES